MLHVVGLSRPTQHPGTLVQGLQQIAADDGEHFPLQGLGVEHGACLLDLVAHVGKQLGRLAHCRRRDRVHRFAEVVNFLERDAQPRPGLANALKVAA